MTSTQWHCLLVIFGCILNPIIQPVIHAQSGPIYTINPEQSVIRFSAQHMGFIEVEGSFHSFEGTFIFYGDSLSSHNLYVELTIDVESIDTDNKLRDQSLRSKQFLDVDSFPAINISVHEVTITDSVSAVKLQTEIMGEARETDTYHHFTNLDFNVETIEIRGETELSLHELGVSFESTMKGLISDRVKVDYHFIAERSDIQQVF